MDQQLIDSIKQKLDAAKGTDDGAQNKAIAELSADQLRSLAQDLLLERARGALETFSSEELSAVRSDTSGVLKRVNGEVLTPPDED